jgi:hypothetical protein
VRKIVVVLVLVVAALAGSLYATAAGPNPFAKRYAKLEGRVKVLERYVDALGAQQAVITTCELPNIWSYAYQIRTAVKAGKTYWLPDGFQPACPNPLRLGP